MTHSIIQKSQLEGAQRLDAEYYQPKYLELIKLLEKQKTQKLENLLTDIRYGIYTEPDYLEEGVDFLRGSNLCAYGIDGDILKVNKLAIPNEKYLLKEGDLLIARSGSVGQISIIAPEFKNATFGSYTIRFRVQNINPYFLYVFLKTKYGRLQVKRLSTQVSQPNINVPNLKLIKILKVDPKAQDKIEVLVKQSYQENRKSKQLYQQAEQVLLEKVGFNKINLKDDLCYRSTLKQVQESHRFDAEHFQPKYQRLIAQLKKTGKIKPLSDITTSIQRGRQAVYDSNGKVLAFTEKHLGKQLLNADDAERTSQNFYVNNPLAQIPKEDILMYSIGAYIGRANIYLENQKSVASSNITIIKPDKERCNPIYLSVFLNSVLGCLQAEQWKASVGQQALYPSDIGKFIIYLSPKPFQQKIADLVQKSYQAQKRAKELLKQAKRKVEELIEE